ncbi:unnamed protein product [Darwinula stevensoni]|uniref:t-SNARE coiled-coil homology domain-containing protein n=1 Tax=Darwinula stevensoni TaxID=69355 RepID=A0A7R9FPX1_9CRUS|nr:unnamed protein product [Darwinula stevensoni]CAG0898242.1 unnamed protein product [Darwinula stevensoni]
MRVLEIVSQRLTHLECLGFHIPEDELAIMGAGDKQPLILGKEHLGDTMGRCLPSPHNHRRHQDGSVLGRICEVVSVPLRLEPYGKTRGLTRLFFPILTESTMCESRSIERADECPLALLSEETRKELCLLLNPKKFLTTEQGYLRDWRGLLGCFGSSRNASHFTSANPCQDVLRELARSPDNTVRDLLAALEVLDRYDVIDDCQHLFSNGLLVVFWLFCSSVIVGSFGLAFSAVADVQNACKKRDSNRQVSDPPAIEEVSFECLTFDDALSKRPVQYHAFVLYADKDEDFKQEAVSELEGRRSLRLCFRDHLLPGINFEHNAVMELIRDRCHYLILVLSPEFFASPEYEFYSLFAQALSIASKQRKIIPIMARPCQTIPVHLSTLWKLDRERYQRFGWDFWGYLYSALTSSASSHLRSPEPRLQVSSSYPELKEAKSALEGPAELSQMPSPKQRVPKFLLKCSTKIKDTENKKEGDTVEAEGSEETKPGPKKSTSGFIIQPFRRLLDAKRKEAKMDSFPSYQNSSGSSGQFQKLLRTLTTNVQKVSQNVQSLKRLVNQLGTSQDTQQLKDQMHELQHYTKQLAEDTTTKIKNLQAQVPFLPSDEQRMGKLQLERLMSDFTTVLNEFQILQRQERDFEREQIRQQRAQTIPQSSLRGPPGRGGARGEGTLIELNAPGSSGFQTQTLMQEEEELHALREKELAVRQLDEDIQNVNEIFKDLATMVHDQGEMVDSIEASVEHTHISVEEGTRQLAKASSYQTSARRKKFIIGAIILACIAVFGLIIYFIS